MDRTWAVRPRAPASHFARFPDLPWPVAQLLYHRQLREPEEVAAFLSREVEDANPFRLRGMTEAAGRIRAAIQRGERIVVHGDFDADGVTSTALMVEGLHALGAEVEPYIPHRVDEGYGLHEAAIQKLHARGVALLVTVDCGIRAHREIELANALGMEVVVTDHHSPGSELPPALAVVNPNQPGCPYPHKGLAGVGIAWKTIQALWLAEQKRPTGRLRQPINLAELLDLVALGTVADIAPLVGENRRLVWRGLEQLRRTQRPGLLALMESARVQPAALTAESIGFFLGPRINAAGRLDSAMRAYDLLRATDLGEARGLAAKLEQLNQQRQALTLAAMKRAAAQLPDPAAPLLLVCDTECPEGIVGLVAGRLQEQFYRPTIVLSQGPQTSRASCRSIPEFHITHALDQVAHLLEKHGGHAAAAGFTVLNDRLPALERALTAMARAGVHPALRPRLVADGEWPLHEISEEWVASLEQLAPFGERNREPLWMCRNVVLRDAQPMGNGNKHLQLSLLDQQRRGWRAVAFRQGERHAELRPDQRLDIAFGVKRSEWQGKTRLELQITDFRPAQ